MSGAKAKITVAEARKALMEETVLPLWPHVALLLNYERDSIYRLARDGHIPTIRMGRLLRVPTAPLRKMLGVDS